MYFSSYSTNKRGVAILIDKNLPFAATDLFSPGRIPLTNTTLPSVFLYVLLGNIYAPNDQDEEFFSSLLYQIAGMVATNMIIGGDLNCTLCPKLDRSPSQNRQSNNRRALTNIIKVLNLLDISKHMNPMLVQTIPFSLSPTHHCHVLTIY